MKKLQNRLIFSPISVLSFIIPLKRRGGEGAVAHQRGRVSHSCRSAAQLPGHQAQVNYKVGNIVGYRPHVLRHMRRGETLSFPWYSKSVLSYTRINCDGLMGKRLRLKQFLKSQGAASCQFFEILKLFFFIWTHLVLKVYRKWYMKKLLNWDLDYFWWPFPLYF